MTTSRRRSQKHEGLSFEVCRSTMSLARHQALSPGEPQGGNVCDEGAEANNADRDVTLWSALHSHQQEGGGRTMQRTLRVTVMASRRALGGWVTLTVPGAAGGDGFVGSRPQSTTGGSAMTSTRRIRHSDRGSMTLKLSRAVY